MPLYYFNLVSPGEIMMRDLIGQDFPDRASAYEAGLATAERHEHHAVFGKTFVPGWYIEVVTEGGELCWQMPIGSASKLPSR